jgi:hypothetical protein
VSAGLRRLRLLIKTVGFMDQTVFEGGGVGDLPIFCRLEPSNSPALSVS